MILGFNVFSLGNGSLLPAMVRQQSHLSAALSTGRKSGMALFIPPQPSWGGE
ncbi:hypothetical protein [Reyranella sp.]|uniref:hypothetical protein n=1 Tax=Reyranella sp. TaxID=1929291 RepID=UPI0037831672